MPAKVHAFCHEGKWHTIEVEDDVTIYAEYPNGATGVFIASTGDWPGSNRLELTMDRAKILCENNELKIGRLSSPLSDYTEAAAGGFDKPEVTWETVPVEKAAGGQHEAVLVAFARHILYGEPLVAEGPEGIRGLEISNAAFLSSWLDKTVTLPIDEELFHALLQEKIACSTFQKHTAEQVQEDMRATF